MKKVILLAGSLLFAFPVCGQSLTGAVVTVTGSAELKIDNDQATVSFFVEEQDKDKAAAASRVNQKMKAGTEAIRKEDPQALLSTKGYYSYPVYSDDAAIPPGQPRKRVLTGWRTGQYLEVRTVNLKQLPATAAAAQKIMALNGVQFGLSDAAIARAEKERIQAGYRNFSEKLGAITETIGKHTSDVVIDSLDFDGAVNEIQRYAVAPVMLKASRVEATVSEPSFEPGITALTIRVTGKVHFK
ncbi:SIMPL domain-containing protein [Undibacterium oligocarboniphilum]|uniref:SIMPL domain-containing protein n=1 Tax=Undibacterium oligocarboniphilum TaxID=666702 RepID=A0A850QCF0_9BURK|nr:SIMPL domain-containing protein [Undibacterium oligocarboniphilum]MBC3869038.1 SIMPL domain-containing protein [Undibacterium oligocarboniphilum]NVO77018.1 SIMPL domain-containing protein [Undibacterium oligocarboniphilum]